MLSHFGAFEVKQRQQQEGARLVSVFQYIDSLFCICSFCLPVAVGGLGVCPGGLRVCPGGLCVCPGGRVVCCWL